MAADLVEVDRVGLAQDRELLAGDLAGAADGEAGAGEGVAADEALGQAELAAEGADLVLEELAQRLDELRGCIRSGRPPTLWWLLIVTEGPPVKLTLSITSG